ncbi:hypothetical protein BF49_3544 [Bradyrhizobium sp.]|nr:hypothetical protein BF49_3544 [Bradyrhizobium sp.]
MLSILITAPAHHIKEQNAPLSCIHHVFDRRGDEPGHRATGQYRHFHPRSPASSSCRSIQSPLYLAALI